MPQMGQGMNPLIMRALMAPQQGIGGPQLPTPPQRPSGSGMGGGYTMTGPAPQQPAKPGVGGMMQNPMQMAQMGQMLKGMMAPPLPIGAASGAPLGGLGPQGASFLPGSLDLTGLSGGLGGMDFGGGLSAPAWNAGGWSPAGWGTATEGLTGSLFGGGEAAGAGLGADALFGGGALAAEGIGAAIAANPELLALLLV